MIDKARHSWALRDCLDTMRGVVAPREGVFTVITLYGLKVLHDSTQFYRDRKIVVDTDPNWDELKRSQEPSQLLTKCLEQLVRTNDGLFGLFRDPPIELNRATKWIGEDRLGQMILTLDRLEAKAHETQDMQSIGEITQTFLSEAYGDNKVTGEYATPVELNRVKAELLLANLGDVPREVYDPTCGIGGNFIAVHNRLPKKMVSEVKYYGQDVNALALYLCAWNLLLHGITRFELAHGDTLLQPYFLESDHKVRRFDLVIADPPLGVISRLPIEADSYQRFRYGDVPGRGADYAFLQHILASLKEVGRAAVSVSHGVFFRSGFEQKIRANLVHADVIRASISLPANLLSYTGIALGLLVFDLAKHREQQEQILFVDASASAVDKRQPKLSDDLIYEVVEAYRFADQAEGFTALAGLAEVQANNYSLLPQRYVLQPLPELPSIKVIDQRIAELEKSLAAERESFDQSLSKLMGLVVDSGEAK